MQKWSLLIKCLIVVLFLSFNLDCQEKKETKKNKTKNLKSQKVEKKLSEREVTKKAKRIDEYFVTLERERGFNGVVLVATGSQIILKKAFGYKNFRSKEPLSTEAVFQLASVSKQFTAAAIMLLKQRGLLDYEDSVQKYIPGFPYNGITIRHLLTHMSGLSNYTYFCDKVWNRRIPITNAEVVNLMVVHKPKEYYHPGVRFDYSNTGYMLLASIVEKVSKMKFEDFMKKYIFDPAGMTSTYIYNHSTPIKIENAAEGYNSRRAVGKTYLDGVFGDKGVYSSVDDLYKWNRILYKDTILHQSTLKEAFSPSHTTKHPDKDNYGFGWRIKNYEGDTVVWHGGWWEGYKTMYIRNLEDHSVIIVLSNSLSGHFRANELLDVLYKSNFYVLNLSLKKHHR